MKRVFIYITILIILSTLFLCKNHKEDTSNNVYKQFSDFNIKRKQIKKKDFLFKDSITNTCHILKYTTVFDKKITSSYYILSTNTNWNGNRCIDNDTIVLKYIDKMSIPIKNKYYDIYKFIGNEDITDAGELVFWSPEYGIIFIRSIAWKIFSKLTNSNNDSINEITSILYDYILNDRDFYEYEYPKSKIKFTPPSID